MKYKKIINVINIDKDNDLLITIDNDFFIYTYSSNSRLNSRLMDMLGFFPKSAYYIYKDLLYLYNIREWNYIQSGSFSNRCIRIKDKSKYVKYVL